MTDQVSFTISPELLANRKRRFLLVFFIGLTVCITPAYEQLYPGVFRHLTPVYLTFVTLGVYYVTRKISSRPLKTPRWIKALFILSGLMLFQSLWTNDLEGALSDTLRIIYIGIIFLIFWKAELSKSERLWGAFGLAIGPVLFILALLKGDYSSLVISEKYVNLINRNVTGSVLATGFCATFYLFVNTDQRKKIRRGLFIFLMLTFVYFIIQTFSRSSILSMFFFMAGYFFSAQRWPNRGMIALTALFGIYTLTNTAGYEDKLKLTEGKDIEYVSSGRTDIWKSILLELPKTNFVGVGTGNVKQLVSGSEYYHSTTFGKYAKSGAYSHNMGLKLLAENGIAGLLLYLAFVYGLLMLVWRTRALNNFVLGAALVSVSFIQFHDYTIAPWFLSALMIPTAEIKAHLFQFLHQPALQPDVSSNHS